MPHVSLQTDIGRNNFVRQRAVCMPIAIVLAWVCCCWNVSSFGQEEPNGDDRSRTMSQAETQYVDMIQPMLQRLCFDCHSGSSHAGDISFDAVSPDELIADKKFWWKVLRNVRAQMMPPRDSDQPTADELAQLTHWVTEHSFEIDPKDTTPGRAPLRRLNRNEYRNTIRELLGIEFNADVVFPPDDTGFGFDNIGEAMSISPMLMEKYLQAAKAIVDEAVPTTTWVMASQRWSGREFQSDDGATNGSVIRHDKPATVHKSFEIASAGDYQLLLSEKSHGSFEFHPGRYKIECTLDDQLLHSAEYKWEENKEFRSSFTLPLASGTHRLSVVLTTLPPAESDESDLNGRFVNYELVQVTVVGPLDGSRMEHPRGYSKIFKQDVAPEAAQERRSYAAEILREFGTRAFRRPISDATLDRLVRIAEAEYSNAGESFESGIKKAYMAVLASPQFLFRFEDVETLDGSSQYPKVDEYGLASRLSYLLWSSMPDQELLQLADQYRLRAELSEQVKRMLRDPKAIEFIRNFAGQWLRARDVEHVSIDPIAARGYQKEYEALRAQVAGRFRRPRKGDPPLEPELERAFARLRELGALRDLFDSSIRTAMRRETEMAFETIVREDRSLLELIDADYIFANDKLAKLYGIDGVQGGEMRRVQLPEGSPRGGVLTQATMLAVTSNPTRTSPVKRGLFILDNILGTPAPPAPPNVPALEDAANRFGGREPSLRELLAVHREAALCSSCHSRMDPLGLALENFDALGAWRTSDAGQDIDAVGELITGERFNDIRELKRILVTTRRKDFYRCVSEKLLVYALGRGLEYYDDVTLENIVDRLERENGRFGALLDAVIESAPFQRRLSGVSMPENDQG